MVKSEREVSHHLPVTVNAKRRKRRTDRMLYRGRGRPAPSLKPGSINLGNDIAKIREVSNCESSWLKIRGPHSTGKLKPSDRADDRNRRGP